MFQIVPTPSRWFFNSSGGGLGGGGLFGQSQTPQTGGLGGILGGGAGVSGGLFGAKPGGGGLFGSNPTGGGLGGGLFGQTPASSTGGGLFGQSTGGGILGGAGQTGGGLFQTPQCEDLDVKFYNFYNHTFFCSVSWGEARGGLEV